MIEYAKQILPKVCTWKKLFRKELIKCTRWVEPDKWEELYNWCYDNFFDIHPDVLEEIYQDYHLEKAAVKIPHANLKSALISSRQKEISTRKVTV